MKPAYDLNSLIKKHQERSKSRVPGDATHVREGVFVSMGKPRPKCPGDATHVKDYVQCSLQSKIGKEEDYAKE